MPLSQSPYGNKPQNLSPVGQPAAPTAVPPVQKFQMPPTQITAGESAPSDVSGDRAPAGDEGAALQALANLEQGHGQPSTDESSALSALDSLGQQEQSGPPEPTALTRGLGVVKQPNGSYGIQDSDGKIRDLTPKEKEAAKYVAKALRVGGPTIGALLGGAVGASTALIPGAQPAAPYVAAATEGYGAMKGGDAVHPAASFFEELAGEKPEERGTASRVAEGAAAVLLPPVVKSFLGSGLKNAAQDAALNATLKGGAEALTKRAEARVQAANEVGLPLRKDQVNMEDPQLVNQANDLAQGRYGNPEAQKMLLAQAEQNQKLVGAFDNLRQKVGPVLDEEAQKNFNLQDHFTGLAKSHEADIADLKAKAYVASKNEPVPVMELSNAFKNVLQKYGLTDQQGNIFNKYGGQFGPPSEAKTLLNKYIEFKDVAGQQGGKGLTLKQLDRFVSTAQENANFGSANRSPIEKAWGEVAHESRLVRDETAASAFDKVGDQNSAARLRAARDFYSSNIDQIRGFQDSLDQAPSINGAVKSLVDRGNPKEVEQLMQLVRPDQQEKIAGAFLDNLAQGRIDRNTGRINASAIEKDLNKYDPKTLDAIFGANRKDLNKLLNYAKIVEKRQLTPDNVSEDRYVKEILAVTTKHAMLRRGLDFVSGLLSKNPTANEYITEQLVKQYPVDTAAAAARKAKLQPVANAINSPGGQAVLSGAGAGGAASLHELLMNRQQQQ